MTAIESGATIGPGQREAWLAERRRSLGASDVAAVLGLVPGRSPLSVYADKLGLAADEPPSKVQRIGLLLEPVIARLYEDETGRTIRESQLFIRDGWRSATLDAVREDDRIVEFKSVNAYSREILAQIGEQGTDEIPDAWLVQLHWQMDLAGQGEADLAVLVGGADFRTYTVGRSDRVVAQLREKAEVFWREHVEARVPPPEVTAADARLIPLLYPDPSGSKVLTADVASIVERYEAWGEQRREAEAGQAKAKAELLLALGDCREGVLADGRRVRRYDAVHPERTQVVKAHTSTTVKVLKARA